MLNFIKIILVFICFINTDLVAQDSGIKIGQKCPDIVLKNLINYKQQSLKLSDLKGKLILIDFWNTWCSSCIFSMERLEVLQKELDNQFFVLPVTVQKKDVITKFWSNNAILKKLSFPSVVEDTVLSKYFPHQAVPYMVWLDENLVVKAITNSQYVNKKNITAMLNKQKFTFIVPKDQTFYDYNEPLMDKLKPLSYSFIAAADDRWKGGSFFKRDTAMGANRFTAINQRILGLYYLAFRNRINWNFYKMLSLQVADSTRYIYNKNKTYSDQWKKVNTYSYEQVSPFTTNKSDFYQTMVGNLDQYFGLRTRIEKRLTKCYVIVDNASKTLPKAIQATELIGLDSLVSVLTRDANWLPVINESKQWGNQKLSISIRQDIDPVRIKEELRKHGLSLVLTERELDRIIIEEIL